jgi:hypothetical protein
MVRALIGDEDCLTGLSRLTTDIHNGKLDARSRVYLVGSRLVGVPKR